MRRLLVLAVLALGAGAPPAHAWRDAPALTAHARGTAELAAGADGRVVAVWRETGRLVAADLAPGGRRFGRAYPVAAVDGSVTPRVALGAAGRLTVAWLERRATGMRKTSVVRVVTGRRGAFGAPQTLDAPERHRGIGVAVAEDGTAYVAFGRYATSPRRFDVHVSIRQARGRRFGPAILAAARMTSMLGQERIPVVAQDGSAAVVTRLPLVTVVDVAASGRIARTTPLGATTWPVPGAVALADGTLVVADADPLVQPVGTTPRLRVRPRGGEFGAPLDLPGRRALWLHAMGNRLALWSYATAAVDDVRGLVSAGPPVRLTTAPAPSGTVLPEVLTERVAVAVRREGARLVPLLDTPRNLLPTSDVP